MGTGTGTPPVRSVKKAMDLLEAVVFCPPGKGGMTLSELSAHMGLLSNTTRNLLKSMIMCGFLEQTDDGRYVPGSKCMQIGRYTQLVSDDGLAAISRALGSLSGELHETTVFATLSGGERVVIGSSDPEQAVTVNQSVFRSGRMYDTPTGRVLMAYASGEELKEILSRQGMPGDAWEGVYDAESFVLALEGIRVEGMSVIRGADIVAWAVPVMSRERVLGAMGCYAPTFRCTVEQEEEIVRRLRETASELGKELSDGENYMGPGGR